MNPGRSFEVESKFSPSRVFGDSYFQFQPKVGKAHSQNDAHMRLVGEMAQEGRIFRDSMAVCFCPFVRFMFSSSHETAIPHLIVSPYLPF